MSVAAPVDFARRMRRAQRRAEDQRRRERIVELRRQVKDAEQRRKRAERAYPKALDRAMRTNRPEDWDAADIAQARVLREGVVIRHARERLREMGVRP